MTDPTQGEQLRCMVIVGTRPEAIKLFPVIHALQASPLLQPFVIFTGQHTDLVRPVFEMAGISPDVDLNVGATPNTLNELVSKIVVGVQDALNSIRSIDVDNPQPERAVTLVHGDTTSAMAGALSAIQMQLPVVHVEAGLRTNDTFSPFPEELNRQLIARMACFHLAPTNDNLGNLVKEHVPATRIFVTGNTGIDALEWAAGLNAPFTDERLADLVASDNDIIVTTMHRRENWGGGLARISEGLKALALAHPEVQIVLPLHPNPRVRDEVEPVLANLPNVLLTEPLEYAPFARLLKRAKVVITDSGGIQEEAPSLGVPVLVTREQTERTEGVAAGTLILVGTDPGVIASTANTLLEDPEVYDQVSARANPYGDGYAARRIVAALETIAFGEAAPTPFGPSFSRRAVLEAAGYEGAERSAYELSKSGRSAGGATRYIGPERRYHGPDRRRDR